jgi:hypothetical protein
MRINYWDGAVQQEVRLTDAPVDLSVDVGGGTETWAGTGLLMHVSRVIEGDDMDATGVDITFDGVDQTVIAILMSNQFRGQPIEVYKVWYNEATGAVIGTPLTLFIGYQNDPYTIGETSTDNPDAVSVTTRGINRLTKVTAENVTLSNPYSHLGYLNRGGVADTTASFWIMVPEIMGLDINWGGPTPDGQKTRGNPPTKRDPDDDYEREDPWYN